MARRCFLSFHYTPDCQRAAQIRQIGAIEGNRPATDNDWEKVKQGGPPAIEKWIANEMIGKSCTIVLVGSGTANRKWINYEIVKSWDNRMGVVGIYVHGIKNLAQETATKGANPFDYITHGESGLKLSSIVKCYDPGGADSKENYAWISEQLANAVEEAVKIRNAN